MSDPVTHGLAVASGIVASSSVWSQAGGDLTLPADGPWRLHHLWGIMYNDGAAADQALNPIMKFNSPTGDIIPDPTPNEFPLASTPPGDTTNCGTVQTPVTIIPVDWLGAGKANVAAFALTGVAAVAPASVVWGIIFSREIPETVRFTHCDHVQKDITGAAETSVGTIRLSERATRLTGVYAALNLNDTLTGGEEVGGWITLSSSDVDLTPGRFPLDQMFHGAYGTPVNLPISRAPVWIPLNTAVPGGADIDISATMFENSGNHATVVVYLAYE